MVGTWNFKPDDIPTPSQLPGNTPSQTPLSQVYLKRSSTRRINIHPKGSSSRSNLRKAPIFNKLAVNNKKSNVIPVRGDIINRPALGNRSSNPTVLPPVVRTSRKMRKSASRTKSPPIQGTILHLILVVVSLMLIGLSSTRPPRTHPPTTFPTFYVPPLPSQSTEGFEEPIEDEIQGELLIDTDQGPVRFTVLGHLATLTEIAHFRPVPGKVFVSIPAEIEYLGTQSYSHTFSSLSSEVQLIDADMVRHRLEFSVVAMRARDGGPNSLISFTLGPGEKARGVLVYQVSSESLEGLQFYLTLGDEPLTMEIQ